MTPGCVPTAEEPWNVSGRTEGSRGCRRSVRPGLNGNAGTDTCFLDFGEFPRFQVQRGEGTVIVLNDDGRVPLVFRVLVLVVLRFVR